LGGSGALRRRRYRSAFLTGRTASAPAASAVAPLAIGRRRGALRLLTTARTLVRPRRTPFAGTYLLALLLTSHALLELLNLLLKEASSN